MRPVAKKMPFSDMEIEAAGRLFEKGRCGAVSMALEYWLAC
ncbi:MAG: hypothetical protein QME85_08230 [Candidatus Saccharicenans sp.]|nr:hypothetical protein [Candidatus Saccharicenans sp.]